MGTYRFDAQLIQPIDEKLLNTWPLIFHELKDLSEFFTPVERGGTNLRLGQLWLGILFRSRSREGRGLSVPLRWTALVFFWLLFKFSHPIIRVFRRWAPGWLSKTVNATIFAVSSCVFICKNPSLLPVTISHISKYRNMWENNAKLISQMNFLSIFFFDVLQQGDLWRSLVWNRWGFDLI